MIKAIKKVANITLDIAIGAWMIFLVAVLIMLITGCGTQYGVCPAYH